MAKLLLLDGNSLAYRAFYAIPDHMSNRAGEITNAVFGFSSMLVTLIREQRPDGLAVCFDRPEPTFRHERQPDYKAQRDGMPEDLLRQMSMVRQLLDALNIPAVDLAGFEADDLLATLAVAAEANGDEAVVVSGDRDTFQLPHDPHIQVLYTLRGVSEYLLLTEAGVEERVGVPPSKYTQYAAMRGDKSDNLPGVPGVGEKTAAKLLADHGDLDAIFAHLDELTPKLRQNLADNEALARENLVLMELRTDAPIDPTQVDIKTLRWQQCDVAALEELFAELEFADMHKRLVSAAIGTPLAGLVGEADLAGGTVIGGAVTGDTAGTAAGAGAGTAGAAGSVSAAGAGAAGSAPVAQEAMAQEVSVIAPTTATDAAKQLANVSHAKGASVSVAFSSHGPGPDSPKPANSEPAGAGPDPTGLAELAVLLDPAEGTVLYLGTDLLGTGQPDTGQADTSETGQINKTLATALKRLFETNKALVNAHNAKQLMAALQSLDIKFTGLRTDTQLGAYLVNPAAAKDGLGDLLLRYSGFTLPPLSETKQGKLDIAGAPDVGDGADDDAEAKATAATKAASERLAAQALAVHHLAAEFEQSLAELGMTKLYEEIERPLVAVLQKMEASGVGVDKDELTAFGQELGQQAAKLTESIHQAGGREFKINSPKELGSVLFKDLGLTAGKKTAKGALSTDAATLAAIRHEHEIVDMILQYREITKLQSTCEKTLLSEVAPDGRIHANFQQTVSRTGRLSSENPNLHAIPVRGEHGLRVRRAFVPRPGFELLVADYDQIELRVVAHLSQDPGLIAMFASGEDVHRSTAAAVFDVKPEKVTTDMRNKAKMVSYGLIYGMEAFGLGQRLGIETGEASKILDAYFAAFGGVKSYMAEVVEQTRERGYTETQFGRRRPLPELRSRNHQVRRAAERQAMNAPVQGLAADIFKIALIQLDTALAADHSTTSSLILQVHDEVILEVAPSASESVSELTTTTMIGAVELSVPLVVAVGIGATWADAKA